MNQAIISRPPMAPVQMPMPATRRKRTVEPNPGQNGGTLITMGDETTVEHVYVEN